MRKDLIRFSMPKTLNYVFLLWFFSVVIKFFSAPSHQFLYDNYGSPEFYQSSILFSIIPSSVILIYVLVYSFKYKISRNIVSFKDASELQLSLIVLLILTSSVVSLDLTAFVTSGSLVIFLIFTAIMNDSCGKEFYEKVSYLFVLIPWAAFAVFGMPDNRWVGGIHPNLLSAFALSGSFFASYSMAKYKWLAFYFCLTSAYLVESRYAIVSILIIIFAEYMIKSTRSFSMPIKVTRFLLIGLIVILSFEFFLTEVLLLNDYARGLGSGISGRSELTTLFYRQFIDQPFGYGFGARERYIGVHNGFLNFILENGVVISFLFFVFILGKLLSLFFFFLRDGDSRQLKIVSYWVAWLFAGYFQPQLINFSDAFAFMTLVLLTMKKAPLK